MRTYPWWAGVLVVGALLLTSVGCNRQTSIRGTPAQIDQVITKLDLIDQRVAAMIDNIMIGFFGVGLVLPFLLPLMLAVTDRDYMPIGKRCLYGALLPAAIAIILALVLTIWPPAWRYVGVDPLYVKVVDATSSTGQKPVLTAEQTQNVKAMRRQTKGYVVGKRGAFVLENPVMLLVSITSASILGALLAYLLYAILPNIYTAARRHQKRTRARA